MKFYGKILYGKPLNFTEKNSFKIIEDFRCAIEIFI